MNDQEGLELAFTGSSIDANFIKAVLADAGISCMIRDVLNESTSGGWGSGAPEDACELYVTDENSSKAKGIIQQYLTSRK